MSEWHIQKSEDNYSDSIYRIYHIHEEIFYFHAFDYYMGKQCSLCLEKVPKDILFQYGLLYNVPLQKDTLDKRFLTAYTLRNNRMLYVGKLDRGSIYTSDFISKQKQKILFGLLKNAAKHW